MGVRSENWRSEVEFQVAVFYNAELFEGKIDGEIEGGGENEAHERYEKKRFCRS